MQDYVPPQLFQLLTAQSWLHAVTQHAQQAQALSAHQARAQFLGEQDGDRDGDKDQDRDMLPPRGSSVGILGLEPPLSAPQGC